MATRAPRAARAHRADDPEIVARRAGIAVSEELFAPVSPQMELCYQTFGDPADEPLLLVMGLGCPMTWWDDELCRLLAVDGFYVIRFDNRDVGRSGRARGRVRRSTLVRAFAGLPTPTPYPLRAMADDVVGLLAHLGLESAHVAGVSMGGMIAQTLAVEHPGRVRSLTSIMSTTGRRTAGWQHPSLMPSLLSSRKGREGYIQGSVALWALIASPAYPTSREEIAARAGETFDRGVSNAGVLRQMAAILTQPDRTAALRALRLPAFVVHGTADKMVHVSGGRATAAAIPGAELMLIDGMGHDLPSQLHDLVARGIRRTADRAGA